MGVSVVRVITMVGLMSVLAGCATLSYPLPKCDGYAKRPLNRSMWEWEGGKQPAGQQQSALPEAEATALAFATIASPHVQTAAYAGFDEAGSHSACLAG